MCSQGGFFLKDSGIVTSIPPSGALAHFSGFLEPISYTPLDEVAVKEGTLITAGIASSAPSSRT